MFKCSESVLHERPFYLEETIMFCTALSTWVKGWGRLAHKHQTMEKQLCSSNSHTVWHAIKWRCVTKQANSNQYCTCCFHLFKHGNRKSGCTQQGEAERLVLWYSCLADECSIFLWALSALKSTANIVHLFVCYRQALHWSDVPYIIPLFVWKKVNQWR